ncbi:hypothetical protein GH714_008613 [Hevea brasiliensis]|uniref:Peptidase A1 domain-containing protein n=1 Tax=Hevea brasiliensis TaxID=3981 RepID=A0A6A6KCM8_HEVBR|nr:hypothetical protein GH714_008613 [Hevea brasiliensis]
MAESTAQSKRLVAKLIHRDSVVSPYYNSNDTVVEQLERSMKASAARLAFLYAQTERYIIDMNDHFQLSLLPSASEPLFLVSFSMGHPPIPQLTIMDTGSSLLWVQCAPCKRCSQQNGPLLDPSKSSTYASLSCNNPLCRHAPGGDCNWLNQCVYKQTYVDGLPSVGVLATEQLVFQNSDGGTNAVPDVVFGCSHENGNYKDRRFTGDGANIEGYSTPIEVIGGHYYITLEGISVGEKRLVIDYSNAFSWEEKRKRVIIDSGTAITWLAENVYRALDNEVRSLLDAVLKPFRRESFLCYKGSVSQDLFGFPMVTFHFSGEADLVLDSESLFYQATADVFCMAVRQASAYGNNFKDFSVIGLMAQQYYNMAYDLSQYKLFFQRIDCELLVD